MVESLRYVFIGAGAGVGVGAGERNTRSISKMYRLRNTVYRYGRYRYSMN